MFILSVFGMKLREKDKVLFTCFMDSEKANDSVCRRKLFELREEGE